MIMTDVQMSFFFCKRDASPTLVLVIDASIANYFVSFTALHKFVSI